MQHLPMLTELAAITALAVLVTVLLARFRVPTVAGLLLAGALLGPFGLALVERADAIQALAEIGVVLLLFTIGLEFYLARLRHILRQVAVGGVAWGPAVLYGFVFAMSSTAIVLRALTERHELHAPHGRFIVGTLIFQDLAVVPMVLIVPLLAADHTPGAAALGVAIALAEAAVVVAAILATSRFVVPRLLAWVDASRSREVFLLAILALCMCTAWLTSLAGLSLALGAFLGGLVVADTEFGHRAMGDILPLRDAFVSIFFVSLGMLFDPRVVFESPLLVAGLLGGFLLLKGILSTAAALAMGFPARVAWLAGVGLAQFGEFGFVLTQLAQEHGVVDGAAMRPLLAAGIISMFLAPLLVRLAPHVTAGEKLLAPLQRLIGVRSIDDADGGDTGLQHHVVLAGFGLAGRFVARTLVALDVPFVAIELNSENVRAARIVGLPVYYGDATSEEALGHAQLGTARALVLLLNDPQAAQRVVATAQRVAPHVPVLMRTRYLNERVPLLAMGATDVVAEEVEGAVEVIARVLRWLDVPRNVIDEHIHVVRTEAQGSARRQTVPRRLLGERQDLAELKIESVRIEPTSPALGRSPLAMNFRARTGALIVAVRRGDRLLEQFDPHNPLEAGDIAYLVGTTEAVVRAVRELVVGPSETA